MKPSDLFKQTIEDYLKVRANTDEQFAVSFAKPNKNIDECVNFIMNTVKESGRNGFNDEEIYGTAVHYYDEDELDTKYLKSSNVKAVVNHVPELTEQDKIELEQKAKTDFYNECMRKQKESIQPKKKAVKEDVNQLSLF